MPCEHPPKIVAWFSPGGLSWTPIDTPPYIVLTITSHGNRCREIRARVNLDGKVVEVKLDDSHLNSLTSRLLGQGDLAHRVIQNYKKMPLALQALVISLAPPESEYDHETRIVVAFLTQIGLLMVAAHLLGQLDPRLFGHIDAGLLNPEMLEWLMTYFNIMAQILALMAYVPKQNHPKYSALAASMRPKFQAIFQQKRLGDDPSIPTDMEGFLKQLILASFLFRDFFHPGCSPTSAQLLALITAESVVTGLMTSGLVKFNHTVGNAVEAMIASGDTQVNRLNALLPNLEKTAISGSIDSVKRALDSYIKTNADGRVKAEVARSLSQVDSTVKSTVNKMIQEGLPQVKAELKKLGTQSVNETIPSMMAQLRGLSTRVDGLEGRAPIMASRASIQTQTPRRMTVSNGNLTPAAVATSLVNDFRGFFNNWNEQKVDLCAYVNNLIQMDSLRHDFIAQNPQYNTLSPIVFPSTYVNPITGLKLASEQPPIKMPRTGNGGDHDADVIASFLDAYAIFSGTLSGIVQTGVINTFDLNNGVAAINRIAGFSNKFYQTKLPMLPQPSIQTPVNVINAVCSETRHIQAKIKAPGRTGPRPIMELVTEDVPTSAEISQSVVSKTADILKKILADWQNAQFDYCAFKTAVALLNTTITTLKATNETIGTQFSLPSPPTKFAQSIQTNGNGQASFTLCNALEPDDQVAVKAVNAMSSYFNKVLTPMVEQGQVSVKDLQALVNSANQWIGCINNRYKTSIATLTLPSSFTSPVTVTNTTCSPLPNCVKLSAIRSSAMDPMMRGSSGVGSRLHQAICAMQLRI